MDNYGRILTDGLRFQLDPDRGVVAGFLPAAYVTIDTGGFEARDHLGA
jgi:hypothetical protein